MIIPGVDTVPSLWYNQKLQISPEERSLLCPCCIIFIDCKTPIISFHSEVTVIVSLIMRTNIANEKVGEYMEFGSRTKITSRNKARNILQPSDVFRSFKQLQTGKMGKASKTVTSFLL